MKKFYLRIINTIKILTTKKYVFPNKRILRIYLDPLKHFDRLFNSYCLDKVNINTNDVIIDCGANVGELNIALKLKNLNVNYYVFELIIQILFVY